MSKIPLSLCPEQTLDVVEETTMPPWWTPRRAWSIRQQHLYRYQMVPFWTPVTHQSQVMKLFVVNKHMTILL